MSLINFTNCFIPVRVAVEPKPILKPDARIHPKWKKTQLPCIHTFTPIYTVNCLFNSGKNGNQIFQRGPTQIPRESAQRSVHTETRAQV